MDEELFGSIAIQKRFISEEDLHHALEIQRQIQEREGVRKLLGIIMLESGMISSSELLQILKSIESRQNFRHF